MKSFQIHPIYNCSLGHGPRSFCCAPRATLLSWQMDVCERPTSGPPRLSWENPMENPRVSGFDVHLNESIDA